MVWGVMAQYYKKLIVAAVVLFFVVAIHVSGVLHYLTFDQLKMNRLVLQQTVLHNYFIAIASFIGMYIVFAACALPGAFILTLAGGFLFGTFWGALYANIGATIGATCAFLMVRYLVGNFVQDRYKNQLSNFNAAIDRYGPNYLLSMRFIALIPFFIINILAAFTDISLWTFIWTTSIGITPGALVYAFAGQQIAYIESPSDIFSVKIIMAFFLLALLALVPVIVRKFFQKSA